MLVNAFDDAGTPCVLPDDRQGQRDLVAGLIARGQLAILSDTAYLAPVEAPAASADLVLALWAGVQAEATQ